MESAPNPARIAVASGFDAAAIALQGGRYANGWGEAGKDTP
ncbi:hypothetical protein [Spirulina major]|nr:hypothetical protein [Spirulina major]